MLYGLNTLHLISTLIHHCTPNHLSETHLIMSFNLGFCLSWPQGFWEAAPLSFSFADMHRSHFINSSDLVSRLLADE